MSLRSGLVREVAFSTPERDRDRDHHCDALSLPFELLAPQKRRPRNTTEHGRRYRRPLSQPDPSADDSDTIPIESSQPDLRTKRSTTTNKDLLVALTETIRQQTETIRNLECETKEIRQNQQALIDHNVKLIDEVAELRTRVLGPLRCPFETGAAGSSEAPTKLHAFHDEKCEPQSASRHFWCFGPFAAEAPLLPVQYTTQWTAALRLFARDRGARAPSPRDRKFSTTTCYRMLTAMARMRQTESRPGRSGGAEQRLKGEARRLRHPLIAKLPYSGRSMPQRSLGRGVPGCP
ncbi:hypothetical protein PSPO01_16633 [Paraphaeosphaeria sporulosa]